MAYLHPNPFLFVIGVFTSYMLLTGRRALKNKVPADTQLTDWLLTYTMLIFGLVFISFRLFNIIKENYFGTVLVVFGGISLLFVYQDFINFKGKSKVKNYGLVTHTQRMMGSYIASVTAFLVVNNTFLPSVMAWLLPTACIVPLLVFWSRKYKVLISN